MSMRTNYYTKEGDPIFYSEQFGYYYMMAGFIPVAVNIEKSI